MESGPNRTEATEAQAPPEGIPGTSDVVEMGPVDEPRICSECLVANSATDHYCTACGADLGESAEATLATPDWPEPPARVVISPPVHQSEWREAAPARRSWGMVAAFSVIALGILGTATFGWLWHNETVRAQHLTTQRNLADTQLAAARKDLAQRSASLKATAAVSGQRKAVLVRAQAVLGKVDRLLSAADGVQKNTTNIQGAGSSVVTAAETMVSDSVTLGNYLIQTDPAYIDATYENQLINTANADIASLRYEEGALTTYDASYGTASTHFGNVADTFTKAVRELQQQLQAASK